MLLADLKPRFVHRNADGRCVGEEGVAIGDAVGLEFNCPADGAHRHFVPFDGRGVGHGWAVIGTCLDDVGVAPSVLVHPNHECPGVHFFITAGEVRVV